MKRLSIIIPAYNVMDHIGKTLHSIFVQNRRDIEIIVINDGSSDDTASTVENSIRQHAADNAVLYSKSNGGVSSARNLGILKAEGEYLLFLDGDDYLCQDTIDGAIEVLLAVHPDVLHWPYNQVNDLGRILVPFQYPFYKTATRTGLETLKRILLLKDIRIWTGSTIYRKAVLVQNDVYFTVGCTAGEDLEFALKVLALSESVHFSNSIMTNYLQRSGSVMNTHSIRKFDSVMAFERVFDFFTNRGVPSLRTLAEKCLCDEIINSYMGTYRMCIGQIAKEQNCGVRKSNEILRSELSGTYPMLGERIRRKTAHRIVKWPMGRIKARLFFVSPIIYFYAARLQDFLRKIRTWRKLN